MQFIQKNISPPKLWSRQFTVDKVPITYADMKKSKNYVKSELLEEQNHLCAYCQTALAFNDTSIEHIVPQSQNAAMSTQYHTLVAVCLEPHSDPIDGKLHCDKYRQNNLLAPLVLYSDFAVQPKPKGGFTEHYYLSAKQNGVLIARATLPPSIKCQVESWIELLNLNHSILRENRKEALQPIINLFKIKGYSKTLILDELNRIQLDKSLPYRQFLLMYLAQRLSGFPTP